MAEKWTTIPEGGIISKPATALSFKTGSWGQEFPFFDAKKCIQCMNCFNYCPDNCILLNKSKSKVIGTNLVYCKGCGICAKECPTGARTMKPKKT